LLVIVTNTWTAKAQAIIELLSVYPA
jgi:hypothetical protein